MTISSNKLSEMGPFQKSYHWSAEVVGVGTYAKSSGIPTMSGENIEVMLRGAYTRELGIYKPESLSISFLEVEKGIVGSKLNKWLRRCYNYKSGCATKEKAQEEITLTLEGCSGGGRTWTLHRALLQSLSGSELQSEGGAIFEWNATIEYDYFEFK